jgi:hypothetical protein
MQVLLVDAPEDPQIRPESGSSPFAGVAVGLALAIPISLPCPLVHAMADGGMGPMAATIALPFVRVQDRARSGDIPSNQVMAGVPVRMVADPPALLARLARDDTDDGRAIIRIGSVSFPFMGAPPGRIGGVSMGSAFFPLRCGTARRLRRRCPS